MKYVVDTPLKEKLLERSKRVVDLTYVALDIPKENTRKADQVQMRAAIGVALFEYVADAMAGAALGRDRTTVLHHNQKHKENLEQWNGYKEKYDVAKSIADHELSNVALERRVQIIDKHMKMLQEKIDSLEVERADLFSKMD